MRRALLVVAVLVMSLLVGPMPPEPAVAGATPRQSLPGVVAGSTTWSLRDSLTSGGATVGPFSYGTKPLVPLMGDWNGDGAKTVGTFEAGTFRLRNANSAGPPDLAFPFGDPRGFPVAGDFDGNGVDDVAVFRNGVWQVHYLGPAPPPDTSFTFGPAEAWPAVVPVAGDWDGDGTDGVGIFSRSSRVVAPGTWVLRDTFAGPDTAFVYAPGTSPYPVVGDWDADGDDTVGVKTGTDPARWLLRNANSPGTADVDIAYGGAKDFPVVWTASEASPPGLSCPADDPYEDNDDAAQATLVSFGATVRAILCPEDADINGRMSDFFAVDAYDGRTIDMRVTFTAAEGAVNLLLRDPAGAVVAVSRGTGGSEQVTYRVPVGGAGRYTLQVYMSVDEGTVPGNAYTLAVAPGPTCPADDPFEDNDDIAHATALAAGTTLEAVLCPDDVDFNGRVSDFFGFDAAAGQSIDLLVGFLQAEGDINVVLWGPAGTVVAFSRGTVDNEHVLSTVPAGGDGRYTLQAYLADDTGSVPGNPYSVTLTLSAPSG